MIIYIENYKLRKGAFADVLIDEFDMKAIKLFKSFDHPDLNGTGKELIDKDITNNYRKKVFETESQAYVNIQESLLLKMFTPKFYGTKKIEKVYHNNVDISNFYLLECCLLIEYIIGQEVKLNILRQNEILKKIESKNSFRLQSLIDEFKIFGVLYTLDSSVIFNDKEFKIIDFATLDSNDFQPIINLE